MLAQTMQECWVARMIEGICASGAADIACAIRDIRPPARATRRFDLYRRIDRSWLARGVPGFDAAMQVDISPWIAGLKRLDLGNRAPGPDVAEPDLQAIRQQQLDVLLLLGSTRPTHCFVQVARFGVWLHGIDGDADGLDEALVQVGLAARPTIGAELRMVGAAGFADRVIWRSEIALEHRSLHLDRRRIAGTFASLAPRLLRRLHRDGEPALAEHASRLPPGEQAPRLAAAGPLTGRKLLCLAGGTIRRRLETRFRHRHGEWWFLAVRCRPHAFLSDGEAGDSLQGFTPLPLPPGHFHADPFLLEHDGTAHLFFEDFDRRQGKAVISHCRLAEDGRPSPPRPALSRPYHLSYPFLFRWRGEIYMIPETAQNRTVELYRCRSFPLQWSLEGPLLTDRRATDATLHEDADGRWWMFASIDEQESGVQELFLFHAETPLGAWQPHAQNPIQCNVRYSRPAGRLFRRRGRLVRPAQDGASHYGSGLWLMEVLTLTQQCYAERPLIRLGPEWLPGNRCLHHVDSCDGFEVIDGMRLAHAGP